jgi:endogenous inhibitor of DNA gyrase (YacG/DUF329 family)
VGSARTCTDTPTIVGLEQAVVPIGFGIGDTHRSPPPDPSVQYNNVMTECGVGADSGELGTVHCHWCRRALPRRTGPGRPRKFCSGRCRQWDWVARHRAAELALNENELVVARTELDALHDELYVLACAVDDVERDLADKAAPTAQEIADALAWLLEAARPLRDREIPAA